MNIKEIFLEKFGKIQSLDIECSEDKLNFIYGLTEDYKSTIIDFIFCILYGTINIYGEDLRTKYIPEDGSDMSGGIVIVHEGIEFVISRTFNPGKASLDKTIIENLAKSTKENYDGNVAPGEIILGINKETFYRNTYLNESASVSMLKTSHTDIMSAILSNIISSASENISVSDVAHKLNNECDAKNPNSIFGKFEEIQKTINVLNEQLDEAKKAEEQKLQLQEECNTLQKNYKKSTQAYDNMKKQLTIQEKMFELDELESFKNNQQHYNELSKRFKEKNLVLSDLQINKHKNSFSECCKLLDELNALKTKKNQKSEKIKSLQIDIGRYTPKDNNDLISNIAETKAQLEDLEYNQRELIKQFNEKKDDKEKIKDALVRADFDLQTANTDFEHFEELSQHKLLMAEERLHGSSRTTETQYKTSNKNLLYTSIIVICLSLIAAIFIFNPIILVFIVLGIIIGISYLSDKVKKEKIVKASNARINENDLRAAQMEMRTIRTNYTEGCDKHKSIIAKAKKNITDLKLRDMTIDEEIKKIETKIEQNHKNIDFFKKQISIADSKMDKPDPRYFTLRNDIKAAEKDIEGIENNIKTKSEEIMKKLIPIRHVGEAAEAVKFVEDNKPLVDEIDELSQKLVTYNNNENDSSSTKKRIEELKNEISKLSKGKNIPKLSEKELLELKQQSNTALENSLNMKEKYIKTITNMKIQFNDTKSIACTENEIRRLTNELKKAENAKKSVSAAIDFYNKALNEMRENYIPEFAKRASEIFCELTNGKYSAISMKGGKILVKDKDRNPINFETISKATCDQIYFSLRLAVAEITSKSLKPPVIMDDVLVKFNEAKGGQILKFLNDYSTKEQVIIFSHHNQVGTLAPENGISLDSINMISLKELTAAL